MPQVAVTPEEAALLLERIARFENEASPQLLWQLPFVREHQALPLYVAWTETTGIRADGTLIRWVTEDGWGDGRELGVIPWVNLALVQGAKRYPELRRLIPDRPKEARTCDQCNGSGTIPGLSEKYANLICKCGGIGWLE
jgi:hypothetical protein